MRCLVGNYVKSWDSIIPQAEFAYNNSVNRTTKKAPFEAAYGHRPQHIHDLVLLPQETKVREDGEAFADHLKKLYEKEKAIINVGNEYYAAAANQHRRAKEFEGDMVHLRREGPIIS